MTAYLRTTDAGSGNAYLRTTAGPVDSAGATFSSGPTSTILSSTSFRVTTTPSKVCVLAVVVTSQGASQPPDSGAGSFDASTFRTGYVPAATAASIVYTGAAAGTAYKAWVQAIDAEGNRTTSSVNVTTPALSPTITSVSSASPALGSSVTITGTNFAASGNTVTLDGVAQTTTAQSTTSITFTVNGKIGSGASLVVTEPVSSLSATYSLTSVTAPTGWSYVTVATPNTTATQRITATPDIASGDQIAWGNVVGGSVTILPDGTFYVTSAVSSFDVRIWSTGSGYGPAATQTLDVLAPTGYAVSITQTSIGSVNQSAIGFSFTGAEVGATYNYSLTSSAGGTPVTGSGVVTSATQAISGINVTSLKDGTVTLTVTLTDASGNIGPAATAVRTKDTSVGGTPNAFSFTNQSGVGLVSVTTSNQVTITGITFAVAVQITNGEYSINGGAWSTANTTISNGSTLRVRNVSSSSFSTAVTTTVNVGYSTATFVTTTLAQDTTPDAFAFTPVSSAAVNTQFTSNVATISGINSATPISITSGLYSINNGAYTSASGVVNAGDTVSLRATSSASQGVSTNVVLNIGGVTATWVITTVAPTTVVTSVVLWDVMAGANVRSASTAYDWFLMTGFPGTILGSGTKSTDANGVFVTPAVVGTQGSGWLGIKKSSDPNYATLIPVALI